MKNAKRRRLAHKQQLEELFPNDLIQAVQSLLTPKDAARTSVLSKSWLHAWSTIPTLRFRHPSSGFNNKQQETLYMRLINRTLLRYHHNNLPITTCHLHFAIRVQKSASRAQDWIKFLTSKPSLKDLRLTIMPALAPFVFPDEIFSSKNLTMLTLERERVDTISPRVNNDSLHFSSNPAIHCLNLRVLELFYVHISDELLHNLFSTCKLLEKINLQAPKGLNKIKVNKLQHLRELIIAPCNHNHSLEISDVPSLHSISYDAVSIYKALFSNTGSIQSLRDLHIDFVLMNDAFSDMINSMFPFLEILTLNNASSLTGIADIRCVSLRRLKMDLLTKVQMKVQVSAPKLLYLGYESSTLPSFVFPSNAPKQIELSMTLFDSIDEMYFINLRDTLNISSKVNINIKFYGTMRAFDINNVRTRIPFPATNVEKLQFESDTKGSWEKSPIVDAFFSICRPNYVVINHPLTYEVVNYFLKLHVKEEAMENKAGKVCWPHLDEIRGPIDGKWETLSSSSSSYSSYSSLLDDWCEFKINWCSP